MGNDEKFLEHINILKKSPVFAMSLGSKELFHSNLWEFLMNHKDYRILINLFFPEIELKESTKIKREYKNRDITVFDGNQEYVIENKIKSYPDINQLERYGEDPTFVKGIITGIKEPPFELPNKWRFVSYSSIADQIQEVKTDDKHLKEIMTDYCNVLKSINCLMDFSLKEKEGRLSYRSNNIDLLDEIRLKDVFRKLKADDFALYCEDLIPEMNEKLVNHKGWEFKISRSFHNGKATLSFELVKYDDNRRYRGQIGIQIEDNQFRIFIGDADDSGHTIKDILNAGIDLGWFDSLFDKKTNRKIFGYSTSMRKNPCNYSGHWVYQYFDIWTKKDQNIQDYKILKPLIEEYLIKAVSIFSEINEFLS